MNDLFNNPIAWAHFRLRGGWGRALLLTGGGCVAMGVLMMLSNMNTLSQSMRITNLRDWSQGLLVLEGAILIFYGASAVAGAVHKDRAERQIESHRLMPLPATRAVAGYLAGAGGLAWIMSAGAAIMSLLAGVGGAVPPSRWLATQAALLGLALLIVVFALMSAFAGRGRGIGGGLIIGLLVLMFFGGGWLVMIFPALMLLILPSFTNIFFQNGSGMQSSMLWITLVMQVVVAGFFYIGAVRRYARDDVTCFGVWPALGLAAIWVLLSCIALSNMNELLTRGVAPEGGQYAASLAGLMLLALLPLANSVRASVQSSPGRPQASDSRWQPVLVLVALLALALPLIMLRTVDASDILQMLLVLAAYWLGMMLLLGWIYRAVHSGLAIGFVWTALLWFVPMVADMILHAIQNPGKRYHSGWLFAVSPLGALIELTASSRSLLPPQMLIGVGVQIALVLIPLLLLLSRRPVQVQMPPPLPQPEM